MQVPEVAAVPPDFRTLFEDEHRRAFAMAINGNWVRVRAAHRVARRRIPLGLMHDPFDEGRSEKTFDGCSAFPAVGAVIAVAKALVRSGNPHRRDRHRG